MAKDVKLIFEHMVADMSTMEQSSRLFDDCMSLSEEAVRRVPLRCRIIALGFVKRFTLEQLNQKLQEQGCPKLYVRSFWEATLVYAFRNGLSYPAWKALNERCMDIFERMERPQGFTGKGITYGELKGYVLSHSDALEAQGAGEKLKTQLVTRMVDGKMAALGDEAALIDFLCANAEAFSPMREKARYYLCKYLYYYLNRRIENYFDARSKKRGVDAALGEMLALKVVTKLRRQRSMAESDARAEIEKSSISCGELFDEFNQFYFGYVSTSWVETLMDCYETVEEIPPAHKKRLADVLRRERPKDRALGDEAVLKKYMREWEADCGDATARSRVGELTLYKCLAGTLDIDRTMLICFLLFFASDAIMPEAHKLSEARMNDILRGCGYPPLNTENDFDWFAAEFLESGHPGMLLMDLVGEYAQRGENSFLYHVYGHSVSYAQELVRVMVGQV